jgi:peptide/nickel transport system substrate-binding protein
VKSAKILKDLGWKDSNGDWILEKDGKDLEFTVLIDDNDPLKVATTRRLQWQLLQAGIRMKVEVLPLAEFVQERLLPGKFQAAIVQENTYDNPDTMASTLWDSSAIGALNIGSYKNPEVDRLIALGRAAIDQKKKAGIYQQIHKLISNDVPAVFLYFKKRYTAASARLGGFTAGQSGQFGASMGSWFVEKTK